MRGARLVLLTVSVLVGCESMGKPKVDDPVFGEAPPRNAAPDKQVTDLKANPRQPDLSPVDDTSPVNDENPFNIIRPIAGEDRPQASIEPNECEVAANECEVAATVNGSPIFASEILDRYAVQLAAARKQASPEQYRKLRSALLQRDLKGQIDRKLLVLALRSTLKPQQIDAVDKHLDQGFEKEISRLKGEFKVDSKPELEAELNKQGTSLTNLRNAFANQQMAREYLSMKAKNGQKIGRQELVDYYQEHLDDYAIPGAVKWRQIFITRNGRDDQAAFDKLKTVVEELKRDVDFADVARRHSDGPTADKGGDWGDWMQAGSLADKKIERALFELPVGVISEPFERDDSYQLVKVTERREPGRVQFADVQAEIQEKLEKQGRQQTIKNVIEELRREAVVTIDFDQQPGSFPQQDEPELLFR